MRKYYSIEWQNHRLDLGPKTLVMGIINVTPDSFSDGGQFFDMDAAVSHGERLAAEGADILDVGGESTRPFSDPVPAEDEIARVVPVIEELAKRTCVPISIDTTKSTVAKRALAAGAAMVNDISALRADQDMAGLIAESGIPVIVMHMLGTPKTMQVSPEYDNLMGDIGQFLQKAIDRAVAAGVSRSKVIVDPGIGFGKTLTHNLTIIRRLDALAQLDAPILMGTSRKAFIRSLLKKQDQTDIPPELPMVETGTQASVAASIINGAHIVRVHDVANTIATATVIDAILNAGRDIA